MWFKRKPHVTEDDTPVPDITASEAIERAREAGEVADKDAQEMKQITRRIREQRAENHFAPLLLDAILKRNR